MKKICKNPFCGKLFKPMDRKTRNAVTCSAGCGDVWRSIREGRVIVGASEPKKKIGCIALKSGVEIRNDLMGKYLVDENYWSFEYSRRIVRT